MMIISLLFPILIGICAIASVPGTVVSIIFFVQGFTSKDKTKKHFKKALLFLIPLIATFILVALWGILAFFGDAIGINNTNI